jgi:hypothetical protein
MEHPEFGKFAQSGREQKPSKLRSGHKLVTSGGKLCGKTPGLAWLIKRPHNEQTTDLVRSFERSRRRRAVEHYVDIVGVTGSIPVLPTIIFQAISKISNARLFLRTIAITGGMLCRSTKSLMRLR